MDILEKCVCMMYEYGAAKQGEKRPQEKHMKRFGATKEDHTDPKGSRNITFQHYTEKLQNTNSML